MTTSLERALEQFDEIFEATRRHESALGIFPAMYRQVTRAIHRAVTEGGIFDDDARVEHLTVVFADRYFEALHAFQDGGPTPACWGIAFDTAHDPRRRMIMQHLLLGMNAHINLDLGISAADVGGSDLESLRDDFVRVNEILFCMVDRLQGGLSVVSPRMALIDRLGRTWDEALMRLGIGRARALAWPFAVRVAEAEGSRRLAVIGERDEDALFVGRLIARRWSPIHLLGRFVASAEETRVPLIMDALAAVEVDPTRARSPDVTPIENAPGRLRDALPRRHRIAARTLSRRRGSTDRPWSGRPSE